jgi:2-amino-4-hydroxy-6-hydroxymethyldihydropteridine diphosphokinase
MTRAFIAVGSNINPEENVFDAVRRLGGREMLVAVSTVYESPAIGRPEQRPYYNCVVAIDTEKSPLELKRDVLRVIENELGRERSSDKYEARTIDLDLIWYDDLETSLPGIMLPDPLIKERSVLAIPLGEIAPDLQYPGSSLRVRDDAAKMQKRALTALKEYSLKLQKLCHPSL